MVSISAMPTAPPRLRIMLNRPLASGTCLCGNISSASRVGGSRQNIAAKPRSTCGQNISSKSAVRLSNALMPSPTANSEKPNAEMFWPQVLRGFAAMFCLLPPTRLALEMLPHKQVPDASGLFNMMRNLGGAVGIALIDTILYGRTSGHIEAIRQRLMAGDVATAQAIGLDKLPQDMSAAGAAIEQAAFAASTNEAWAMLAAIAVLGLLLIPLARSQRTDAESS